ncbi:hypothetical protein GCM10023074_14830 [Microbispora amethystogenes]
MPDFAGGGTSVTSPVNASERAVARYSGPPSDSGQRALTRTLLVAPPVIRFGSTVTRMSWREIETSGVGTGGVSVMVGSA